MEYEDITNIRRENARMLAKEVGGPAEFGRRVAMADSQITHLIGAKKTKNIGSIIARRIEKAFGKPTGWLDTYHPPGGNVMFELSPDEVRLVAIYRSSSTARILIDGAVKTSFNLLDQKSTAQQWHITMPL